MKEAKYLVSYVFTVPDRDAPCFGSIIITIKSGRFTTSDLEPVERIIKERLYQLYSVTDVVIFHFCKFD